MSNNTSRVKKYVFKAQAGAWLRVLELRTLGFKAVKNL